MRRLRVPSFLRDLAAEPGALRVLVVAAASLFAAGLDPKVYSPGLSSVQSAVRARPELETILLVAVLVSAGLLFVGGILGDAFGRRWILLGALGVLVATGFGGLVVSSGPVFLASRFMGAAASSIVLPFAFALIATTFRGVPRATAIGLAYAVYGAATGIGPTLLTLFGPDGSRWPAFLASGAAAAFALWVARSSVRNLEAARRSERPYVVGTAVWAFAVVMISASIIGFGNGVDDPLRLVFIGVGLALLAGFGLWERRRRAHPHRLLLHVERRPITIAVAVGVVIGFAQAAPLLVLPQVFQIVFRYGPLLATAATAPFIIALVVAGPIAGGLLARFGPRTLVAGGVAALGIGNLVVAVLLGPTAAYVGLILPFVLIGAGFVVATTVRTAIIFASVPRGLPATAAALNEASVVVGSRIGLVVTTVLVTQVALESYSGSLAGIDPAQREAAVGVFRDLLTAFGTPAFGHLVAGVAPGEGVAYIGAYTDAVRLSLAVTGLIALATSAVAWVALGPRDPLATVWEHRDEREGAQAVPS